MVYLKLILYLAIDEGMLNQHPMRRMKSLSNKDTVEEDIKFWTPEQFKSFLPLISDKKHFFKKVYFTFAYFTGARVGEMLALEWSDFNSYTNEIKINKNLSRIKENNDFLVTTPKNPNSRRNILINKKLVLKEWKLKQKEGLRKYGIEQTESTRIFKFNHNTPDRAGLNLYLKTLCKKTPALIYPQLAYMISDTHMLHYS
ncbi:tyrosine-type recombinase/integrase [Bacillus sp. ISL-51]|nr:tyrosine-type recombinase/integrase [Bacillus sp. ISL-51]